MSKLTLTTAALASLLLSGAASAKTLTVSKGGKYPSIQSAVNAASPGDRIKVESGTYRENILVTGNRAGLTIEGSGKVIIDAYPSSGFPAGPGIRVLASDVTLRDLNVENARSNATLTGDGVYVSAARATLDDLKVVNCQDAGIYMWSTEGSIRDCVVRSCHDGVEAKGGGISIKDFKVERVSNGILVEGNGVRISECDIAQASSYGVEVSGNDARMKGCDVLGASSSAFHVVGDDARVVGCRSEAVTHGVSVIGKRALVRDNVMKRQYGESIELEGPDHKVIDNTITDCGNYAIEVRGDGATITGNKTRLSYGNGIFVDGGGFVIADNDVRDSIDGYDGIHVRNGIGGLIVDNDIRGCSGRGVNIDDSSQSIDLRDNKVTSCGKRGYEIDGDDHTVIDNVASKCGDDGFRVSGSLSVLKGNEARSCDGDGFDAESGSQFQFRDNLAKKNGAEGFEIGSSATLVKNNVAEKNRLDLTNSGTNNTFEGNEFKTGGTNVAGQLD